MKFTSGISRSNICPIILLCCCYLQCAIPMYSQDVIWKLGESDNDASDMALAPASYEQFLHADFGWEDRYFLAGYSDLKKDWPYILPGPKDHWGGTGPTSGIRSQLLTVLFGLESKPAESTVQTCHRCDRLS